MCCHGKGTAKKEDPIQQEQGRDPIVYPLSLSVSSLLVPMSSHSVLPPQRRESERERGGTRFRGVVLGGPTRYHFFFFPPTLWLCSLVGIPRSRGHKYFPPSALHSHITERRHHHHHNNNARVCAKKGPRRRTLRA